MTSLSLIFVMGIVIAGASVCLLPNLSMRGMFFGVTVDPEFQATVEARYIVSQFRRWNLAVALPATITLLALNQPGRRAFPIVFLASVVIQYAVGVLSFARAHRLSRPFAISQPVVRTAAVIRQRRKLPGGWLLFSGPFLFSIATFIMLISRRAHPSPEAYDAARASWTVGFTSAVLFLVVGLLGVFRTPSSQPHVRRYGYWLYLAIAYYSAIFPLTLSALGKMGLSGLRIYVSATTCLSIAFIVIWRRSRTAALHAQRTLAGDGTPDACWKWGLIYYNPADPAFLVTKRAGLGWTLNYGSVWSWVFSIVILAAPFVIRFVWFRNL